MSTAHAPPRARAWYVIRNIRIRVLLIIPVSQTTRTCARVRVRGRLSLDEHVAKFDDPGKIATFSDGGKDAEAVRSCGEDLRSGVVDPAVKKRMLNRLRKHPHLQKALRRLIANATGGKRKPVKKTHIEILFEILLSQ